MNSREVIKRALAAGWVLDRINGDHHTFKHPDNDLLLTIVHPKREIGAGLLRRYEKITGLNLRKK